MSQKKQQQMQQTLQMKNGLIVERHLDAKEETVH